MAAGVWTPTATTRTKMLTSQFDFDTDSFKCALFLSTSNLGTASTTYAGCTNEHANANGYATGGIAVTFAFTGTTSVTVSFASNPVWTASGGSIIARFAAIYEVSGDVVAFCLLDSSPADVTATTGNTLTLDSDGSPAPVFTLA
jgi:hypothetical protein